MNTRLDHDIDWVVLAQGSNWSVTPLAKKCGVSVRTLERHFQKKMGKTPKDWLTEQRQRHGVELLRAGSTVKEAATNLGYKYAHHFSQEFKKYWGCYPTQMGRLDNKTGSCRIFV